MTVFTASDPAGDRDVDGAQEKAPGVFLGNASPLFLTIYSFCVLLPLLPAITAVTNTD